MKFNADRASTALADAAFMGDKRAAEKHGVSARSFQNWRDRLSTDADFASLFDVKRQTLEREWAKDLPAAIRGAIDFLGRAARDADTKDPNAIHAVAGALKILADVTLTSKVLDARLAERSGRTAEGAEPDPGRSRSVH